MPDTANDETQVAGQPDVTADDTTTRQIIADTVAQSEPSQDDPKPPSKGNQGGGDPWADPEAARKEIEKLRRESAGWRTKYREAEPQLSEYQTYLESQKTEQQKLTEAKESAERELAGLRSANARLMAAATHNLPPELIDLLGDGTEEQIGERARLVAEKLAAAARPAEPEPKRPAATRPVESLTAGAQPTGAPPTDMDAVLRAMAGRT